MGFNQHHGAIHVFNQIEQRPSCSDLRELFALVCFNLTIKKYRKNNANVETCQCSHTLLFIIVFCRANRFVDFDVDPQYLLLLFPIWIHSWLRIPGNIKQSKTKKGGSFAETVYPCRLKIEWTVKKTLFQVMFTANNRNMANATSSVLLIKSKQDFNEFGYLTETKTNENKCT